MGRPETIIAFEGKAQEIAKIVKNGISCIVVNDDTVEEGVKYFPTRLVPTIPYEESIKKIVKDCMDWGNSQLIVCNVKTDTESLEGASGKSKVERALDLLNKVNFQFMAFNFSLTTEEHTLISDWLDKRFKYNRPTFAILVDTTLHSKFIGNWVQDNIEVANEKWTKENYSCRIASALAGTEDTNSATFKAFKDVTSADEYDEETEDAMVDEGKLFMTFDGEKYKLCRAVNTLVTLGANESTNMKKIKCVQTMSLIKRTIANQWEDYYVSLNGSYDNKVAFFSYMDEFLGELLSLGVISTYTTPTFNIAKIRKELESMGTSTVDIEDEKIPYLYTGSKLFATVDIGEQDALEDLDLVVNVVQ